jgi:hypothetical protein
MTLRRVENVKAVWHGGLVGLVTHRGHITVTVGRRQYRGQSGLTKDEWQEMVAISDGDQPVSLLHLEERQYWRFEGHWYADNEDLSADEVRALLIARGQRRRATINRAQTIAAMSDAPPPVSVRGAIPDDMRLLVLTRDEGRCRQCGSTSELQFDHIIPWSKGGATSPENLQVLCGPCNRRKGASVASPGHR